MSTDDVNMNEAMRDLRKELDALRESGQNLKIDTPSEMTDVVMGLLIMADDLDKLTEEKTGEKQEPVVQRDLLKLLIFLRDSQTARVILDQVWKAAMQHNIVYETDNPDLSDLPPLKTTED